MNSRAWTMAAALALAAQAALGGETRSGSDDDWCRESGWNGGRARHCEVRETALPAGARLHVDARPNGGIEVKGWDRGEARLRVRITAMGDTAEEARAVASQVRVVTDGAIRATGPEARDGERRWYASFRLDVPRDSDVDLQADNGGLHVSGMAGHVRLSTVNGGIHLDDNGGKIEGSTSNGGVHVNLSGSEWQGEGLDVRTTNGGVHLEIPEGYNARLETSTVNGGIHSDLPVAGGRGRHRSGGRIETDLGRGGATLRLTTTNGGLHVSRE
jgi:putative adhesin